MVTFSILDFSVITFSIKKWTKTKKNEKIPNL